ncbi:MAG: hypothetical protein LBC44_04005 [Mycoplasmataceae bacterium]|jgi:hypothetical protein|nr:hypothetical protein [Mycoplasmataceae bacterium]
MIKKYVRILEFETNERKIRKNLEEAKTLEKKMASFLYKRFGFYSSKNGMFSYCSHEPITEYMCDKVLFTVLKQFKEDDDLLGDFNTITFKEGIPFTIKYSANHKFEVSIDNSHKNTNKKLD